MDENSPAIFPESIIPDKVEESALHIIENNDFINSREVKKFIELGELNFYPHPKFKRDYVKIDKNNVSFDWEQDVLNKSPMFRRITLILTKEAEKELDLEKSRARLYFLAGVIFAILLTFISIFLTLK